VSDNHKSKVSVSLLMQISLCRCQQLQPKYYFTNKN